MSTWGSSKDVEAEPLLQCIVWIPHADLPGLWKIEYQSGYRLWKVPYRSDFVSICRDGLSGNVAAEVNTRGSNHKVIPVQCYAVWLIICKFVGKSSYRRMSSITLTKFVYLVRTYHCRDIRYHQRLQSPMDFRSACIFRMAWWKWWEDDPPRYVEFANMCVGYPLWRNTLQV